jgi:hypothetical protein
MSSARDRALRRRDDGFDPFRATKSPPLGDAATWSAGRPVRYRTCRELPYPADLRADPALRLHNLAQTRIRGCRSVFGSLPDFEGRRPRLRRSMESPRTAETLLIRQIRPSPPNVFEWFWRHCGVAHRVGDAGVA